MPAPYEEDYVPPQKNKWSSKLNLKTPAIDLIQSDTKISRMKPSIQQTTKK